MRSQFTNENIVGILRSLIEEIVLTPVDRKHRVEIRGILAGILTIATCKKAVPWGRPSVAI